VISSSHDDGLALDQLARSLVAEERQPQIPGLTAKHSDLLSVDDPALNALIAHEQTLQLFAQVMKEARCHQSEQSVAQHEIPWLVGPVKSRPVICVAAEHAVLLGMSGGEGESVVDGGDAKLRAGDVSDQPVLHVTVRVADEVVEDAHLLEFHGEAVELGARAPCSVP